MADKDVTISQLLLQVDLLRSQVLGLERANAQLRGEVRQLRADNQKLQDQIARLKRNSSNSSKPPSSDIVKPKKNETPRGKRRRKIGGQKGHPRHERIPFPPDDIGPTLPHEWSAKQAEGLIPLEEWFVLQQVDLVAKPYVVTEHRARKYLDPRTGRIVIAPLPVAVKAAGLVGPKLSALAAYQKGDCHMSYSTIQRFWNEVLGIPISRSQLVNVIQKASAAFAQPYAQLREALVQEPYVGADESGHKDWGDKLWAWCFRASRFTVFHIDPSRGSEVLKAILTETFGGVVGSDSFSAYHKYLADCGVLVQFCWAHLIRDIRFLADDYFRFLTTPGIEPTNNQTEQAIRHIVIDRHITQGTRGERGQRWCERVWTILATCRQQGRRAFEFFCQAITPASNKKPPRLCYPDKKSVNGYSISLSVHDLQLMEVPFGAALGLARSPLARASRQHPCNETISAS